MISRPNQELADTILGTTQTPQLAISEMGIGSQQGDTGSGTLALQPLTLEYGSAHK